MTFGVFPPVLRPVFEFAAAGVAPASNWWEVAGKTCVAAYQPKGAASLAASYTNLANPGTYDAAPGVAPSWASGAGWTFDVGSYLNTGLGSLKPFTAVAAVTPAGSGYRSIFGTTVASGFEWQIATSGVQSLVLQNIALIGNSSTVVSGPSQIAVSYSNTGDYAFYLGNSADGSGNHDETAQFNSVISLGTNSGTAEWFLGDVAAIALYDSVLLAVEVLAVLAAMAAL